MGVRTEQRNFRSNIVGRMQPSLPQYMRRHSRSGRFAVHAGDHDSALAGHDCRQRLGATHQLPAEGTSVHEDWVVLLDRRGKNYHVGIIRVLRSMLRMETES